MKSFPLIVLGLGLTLVGHGQVIYPPPPSPSKPMAAVASEDNFNYAIDIQWKTSKSETNFLRLVTTDGAFTLDTVQTNRVKVNNNDVPVSLHCSGMLRVTSYEKARLNLALNRNVPYVTGVNIGGGVTGSTYQQLQAGLNSTYVVTFGKPLVIQSDGNEEITLLVTRLEENDEEEETVACCVKESAKDTKEAAAAH